MKRDILRFNLGLHWEINPISEKCDQKIFHGKFLYLSLRFEMQRSLIWECSRAKLNLGGMPERLRKWKSENCDQWCEGVSCGDFCTVFLGF
jgi:hypothetical protein